VIARLVVPLGIRLPIPPSPPPGGTTGLLKQLASDLIGAFFRTFERWEAGGTVWVLGQTWRALSATTEPVLTGGAFTSEYHVMTLIGVGTILPLLGLAIIQAIAHQDVSALLRTAFLRLPMAILLTFVVIEIVSLGLTATDRASSSLLATGGAPAAGVFVHLSAALTTFGSEGLAGFGGVLVLAVVAIISFVLWIELAVRSAAVAVAALFLPLALAGLVWPATSHWARRLGETLTSLVVMKLVMAAVLALAAGALAAGSGGIASVVEGLALLGLTASSPYAVFHLVPMVEGGAASQLQSAGSTVRRSTWSMASNAAGGLMSGATGGAIPASGSAAGSAIAASIHPRGTSVYGGGSADGGATGTSGAGGPGNGGGGAGGGSSSGSGSTPGGGSPASGDRDGPGAAAGKRGEGGWTGSIMSRRPGDGDAQH
jgi:hypothetical protein